MIRRVPLDDLVAGAMSGALVNGPCVAGVFAAAEVVAGRFTPRPVDAPWDRQPDRVRGEARRALVSQRTGGSLLLRARTPR